MGTYELLVQRIVSHMKLMNEEDASSLAFKITESLNYYLIGNRQVDEDKLVTDLIPYSVRSRAILSIGWDALRTCENIPEHEKNKITFLSTMPSSYRLTNEVNRLRSDSGIWAGSLLLSISEIINSAKKELFIISPYWSTAGIKSLINNLDSEIKKDLSVFILTQPKVNLHSDELFAIEHLVSFFIAIDASVRIFAPIVGGTKEPLLHAKTVIGDGKDAYIGSANYTAHGIEHSVEVGVRVQGGEVKSLNAWACFLMKKFSKWD